MTPPKFKDSKYILDLITDAQSGNSRAENKLVIIYIPYVEYMVRKYSHKTDIKCDDDLRAYINLGLLDGIRKFNPNKNTRFIYFAHTWMKKNIFLGEMSYRFIRLPVNQKLFYSRFLKEHKDVEESIYFDAEMDEIQRYLIIKESNTSVFSSHMMFTDSQGVYEFPEKLLNDTTESEYKELENKDSLEVLKNNIRLILANFSTKEVYIINNVFGLNGYRAISIDQIAYNLGVTKVNIAFTKSRVIRMLRHQSLSNSLLEGL